VHAISWAEKNMGDYKLKSDDKYVVPEHQRINAEKKRRELVLLEESVFAIKMVLVFSHDVNLSALLSCSLFIVLSANNIC